MPLPAACAWVAVHQAALPPPAPPTGRRRQSGRPLRWRTHLAARPAATPCRSCQSARGGQNGPTVSSKSCTQATGWAGGPGVKGTLPPHLLGARRLPGARLRAVGEHVQPVAGAKHHGVAARAGCAADKVWRLLLAAQVKGLQHPPAGRLVEYHLRACHRQVWAAQCWPGLLIGAGGAALMAGRQPSRFVPGQLALPGQAGCSGCTHL